MLCSSRPVPPAHRTCGRWRRGTTQLARIGAELLAARIELVAALAPLVDKAYDSVSRGGGPTAMDYHSSLGDDAPLPPDADVLAAALLAQMSALRRRGWTAGSPLSGRTVTTCCSGWARCRRVVTPATVSPGPTRSRCGWPRTTCCAGEELSRCSSSTTCSLSSTPTDRNASPSWSLPPSKVLVAAAVAADVPEQLAGARFDVAEGQVRRVR